MLISNNNKKKLKLNLNIVKLFRYEIKISIYHNIKIAQTHACKAKDNIQIFWFWSIHLTIIEVYTKLRR